MEIQKVIKYLPHPTKITNTYIEYVKNVNLGNATIRESAIC